MAFDFKKEEAPMWNGSALTIARIDTMVKTFYEDLRENRLELAKEVLHFIYNEVSIVYEDKEDKLLKRIKSAGDKDDLYNTQRELMIACKPLFMAMTDNKIAAMG